MKEITEDQIIKSLNRQGCDIHGSVVDISHAYKSNKLGNKSYGRLDFLVRRGYWIVGFLDGADYCPRFAIDIMIKRGKGWVCIECEKKKPE